MLTHLGLFYFERLGNYGHCMFIFTFLRNCFSRIFFCTRSNWSKWFSYRSVWPIDRIFKPVQTLWIRVDMGVMAVKGYSILPASPKLEPYHQIQLRIIPRTPHFFWWWWGLPLCKGDNQCILSHTDRSLIVVLQNERIFPFNFKIAITPRSTPTQISCTCLGHIYGSNRIVQSFINDYYY